MSTDITNKKFRVFVGWDHAVDPRIQDAVVAHLTEHPSVISVKAFGPKDVSNRVDYPDVATEVCANVVGGGASSSSSEKQEDDGTTIIIAVGVLICGSGIGMSIAANKVPGIRAALCHDHYTAEMCRRHNNANVICAGARSTGLDIIKDMLTVFLTTAFEGGRHETRVGKIMMLEPCAAAVKKE